MKKVLKMLFAFALIFVLSFYSVKAQEETGSEGGEVVTSQKITEDPVVSIRGNNNSLILSWDAVPNAVFYRIERSTSATKGFKRIATTYSTTYTNTKLPYGNKYYYRVTAVGYENKTISAVVSRKVVPNKVANVKLAPGSTNIKVTWSKTSNSGYVVYRSTNGSTWTKVSTIKKNTTTSFNDKNLKSNKIYYYQVVAYQIVGKKAVYGTRSEITSIRTAPAAPSVRLTSMDIESMNIRIASVAGAVKYRYYSYNEKTKRWEFISDILPEWFDDGYYREYIYAEKPYHTYKFKVRACSATVCGSWTEVSGQSRLATVQIEAIRAEKKAADVYIEQTWDGAGYEVYRATSKTGKYTKVTTLKGANKTILRNTGLTSGKTYYYKVRTYIKISGKYYYSSYSAVRSVKVGSAIDSAYQDAKVLNKEWFYSKQGLINALVERYGYSASDAKKGVEKCNINFNINALNMAKDMLQYSLALSEEGIKTQLINEFLYTESEAEYAINNINVDYHQSLLDAISNEIRLDSGYGRQYYIDEYTSEDYGFTEEDVDAVLTELNVNFDTEALRRLNYILNVYAGSCVTRAEAIYELRIGGFTEDNINYALENAPSHDWAKCIMSDYNNVEFNNDAHVYNSRAKLIQILTGSDYRYTEEEVTDMLDELNINFNEFALGKANNLLGKEYLSRQAVESKLVEELFTEDEINYALSNITEIDFGFNAYMVALENENVKNGRTDRGMISTYLDSLGFTSADIESALGMFSDDKWVVFAKK